MGKTPAALIVIVLLTTVASVAARPLLSTANAMVPGVVNGFNVRSNTYSVDVTSVASLLLSPERAISAVVHGIKDAAEAKSDQATVPINEHEVTAGDSVHITHVVENQAVTVSVEITVNVGEPASVTHTTEPHPPEPDRPGSD